MKKTGQATTEKVDRPEWKTFQNLHLDMNPWSYYEDKDRSESDKVLNGLRYRMDDHFIVENNQVGCISDNVLNLQALINLHDNTLLDGGFQLVPGFKNYFVDWVKSTMDTLKSRYGKRQTFIVLPEDEPLQQQAKRITCRAGSIIIWDQMTAHGSAPNDSNTPRYAQFFKVFPAIPMGAERRATRSKAISQRISDAGFTEMTELGKKILGVEPWE